MNEIAPNLVPDVHLLVPTEESSKNLAPVEVLHSGLFLVAAALVPEATDQLAERLDVLLQKGTCPVDSVPASVPGRFSYLGFSRQGFCSQLIPGSSFLPRSTAQGYAPR